jgi:hypothetical protein
MITMTGCRVLFSLSERDLIEFFRFVYYSFYYSGPLDEGHLRLQHTHQLIQNKRGSFGGPAGIRTPDQGIMSPLL